MRLKTAASCTATILWFTFAIITLIAQVKAQDNANDAAASPSTQYPVQVPIEMNDSDVCFLECKQYSKTKFDGMITILKRRKRDVNCCCNRSEAPYDCGSDSGSDSDSDSDSESSGFKNVVTSTVGLVLFAVMML